MQPKSAYRLPFALTIETVEALAAEWREKILPLTQADATTSTVLDCADVQAITTPGIQLLVSLDKFIRAQGGSMRLVNAGEFIARALKDSGMETLLKQPEEA